jgi:hypothetical protein
MKKIILIIALYACAMFGQGEFGASNPQIIMYDTTFNESAALDSINHHRGRLDSLTGGKNLHFLAGVIRGDGDGTDTAWSFIQDGIHDYYNFTSVICTDQYIQVRYPVGSKVISFLAVPDEAYALKNCTVGSSVGTSLANIYITLPKTEIFGLIAGSASGATTAYTASNQLGIDSVRYDSSNGSITIHHTNLGTTYYDIQLTPKYELGTTRPIVYSVGGSTSIVRLMNSAGAIETGAATTSKKFWIKRSTPSTVYANPKTLNVSGSNIWIFAIIEY